MTLLLLLLASIDLNDAISALPRGESARVGWKVPTHGRVHHSADRTSCCVPCNEMTIVATIGSGKIDDLRLYACECEVRGGPVRMLAGVDPASSIAFLLGRLHDEPREIITAVALHDHPRVISDLIALARRHENSEVRRHALFWLSHRAGERAAGELRRAVDEDPDDDVRQHAVFAISQLPSERAVPMLIELAKSHRSRAVRKKAIFWLGQTDDPRALALFEEILIAR